MDQFWFGMLTWFCYNLFVYLGVFAPIASTVLNRPLDADQ